MGIEEDVVDNVEERQEALRRGNRRGDRAKPRLGLAAVSCSGEERRGMGGDPVEGQGSAF
jgi:hypothetical protein